jgi:hypothetical protein
MTILCICGDKFAIYDNYMFFYVVTRGGKQNRQHICVLLGSTSVGYDHYQWKLIPVTSVGSDHSRQKFRYVRNTHPRRTRTKNEDV